MWRLTLDSVYWTCQRFLDSLLVLFGTQMLEFLLGRRGVRGHQLCRILLLCVAALFAYVATFATEPKSSVVVLSDAGFPTADSAGPSAEQLQKILVGARLVSANQLRTLLNDPTTRLLVLPYGSAFPEEAWEDIYGFLS